MPSLVTLSLPLTALYSGAVGMLFALLSLRAAFYRGSKGRNYYYGDHNTPKAPRLQGIVHSQTNLAEYYAAFFLLFAVLEFNKTVGSTTLHGLGIWFLLARISHALQLSIPDSCPLIFRAFGFLSTFGAIIVASMLNIVYGIHRI